MTVRTIQFFAIVVSALALVPSGAHLFALPNKIGLSQPEYLTAQSIYYGWAILGILWPAGAILSAALAFLIRQQGLPFWLAALAALCFVAMLIVFFVWTFPANQATENWVVLPENWETLRRQWEYSHAVNAALALLAFCLVTMSVVSWRSE
jgi:hypothetical protein